MSSVTTLIKDRIKTKLEGIDKIQEVYDKPQLEFGGFPAATITPIGIERGENPPENSSVERVYVFSIRLYYDVDRDNNNSVGDAVDALYDLADDVMNEFDDDLLWNQPSSFQSLMPENYKFIINESVTGDWDQESYRSPVFLDVMLRSHIYKNIGTCT